jgi:hypothetical protein
MHHLSQFPAKTKTPPHRVEFCHQVARAATIAMYTVGE